MTDATTQKSDLVVSVVCTVHNGEDFIRGYITALGDMLKARFVNYEIVIVDDASTDETSKIIHDCQQAEPNIQNYRLARAVGTDIALVAGLDQCLGDAVITLDPRYDPITPIPEMIEKFQDGYDIVYGERRDRAAQAGGGLYQWGARLFFRGFRKITGHNLPEGMSTLQLISRRTLGAILDNTDRYSLLRVLPAFTGFRFTSVLYDRTPEPQSSRKLFTSLRNAFEIVLLSSVWPLRALAILSIAAAFVNLLYMIYVVLILIIKDQVAEGWVSMSLQISGLFFLLFFVLGILAEYVGRLFMQNQRRARYIIAEENTSESLASKNLLNIYSGER